MLKEDAIKLITESKDTDFVVRSNAEETAFLANHETAVLEKGVKPFVGKLHAAYAKDFEEVFGEKVPEGVKPYKWIKEKGPEYVKRAKESESFQAKVTELEKQIKDGNLDGAAKTKIEALEKELNQVKELHKKSEKEWEGKFTTEKQATINTRKKSDLSQALVGMKFIDKSVLAEDVRQIVVDQKISEVMAMSEYDDKGVLIFKDQDGNVMRNQKTAEPLTALQVLTEKLSSIIDKGIQQPGTGGKGKENGGSGDIVSPIAIPATITTLVQLTTFLSKLRDGGEITQDQYNLAFKANHKQMKKQ